MQYQTNRPVNNSANCYRMACTNTGNFYYGWTSIDWGQSMGLPVRCVRDENPFVPTPEPEPDPEPTPDAPEVEFGGTIGGIVQ
jgi:hypothetical protein